MLGDPTAKDKTAHGRYKLQCDDAVLSMAGCQPDVFERNASRRARAAMCVQCLCHCDWLAWLSLRREGTAETPRVAQEYASHIEKYLPTLRSYGLDQAADHLEAWISNDGSLELEPLLDISA